MQWPAQWSSVLHVLGDSVPVMGARYTRNTWNGNYCAHRHTHLDKEITINKRQVVVCHFSLFCSVQDRTLVVSLYCTHKCNAVQCSAIFSESKLVNYLSKGLSCSCTHTHTHMGLSEWGTTKNICTGRPIFNSGHVLEAQMVVENGMVRGVYNMHWQAMEAT